jgi:hypothetical protein
LSSSCTSCRMGSTNAAVLPEPVSAAPQTSPPPRMAGSASSWMAVGRSQPWCCTPRSSCGHSPW